jgi:hypothetical protein
MTTIDFAPGMHGHFLSYVINQYIFDINVPIDNIFQKSGAAHTINLVPDFLAKRICLHGHYSYFELPYPVEVEKIIFIKHDPTLDFLLLTNIYHRCHPEAVKSKDMNIEEIKQLHMDSMFSPNKTTKDLRNDWYTKLQERHLKKSEILQASTLPRYDFDFSAFFDPTKFVQELSLCADFLQHRLHFSSDLLDLHHRFLHINQGYQKWLLGQTIIHHILQNKAMVIDINDWQLHSYINHSLSNLVKIYDGRLWRDETYPNNTEIIYGILKNFLDQYDDLF